MIDSTARLARASAGYSARRKALSLAYRDRNAFRPACSSEPVAYRPRRVVSPAVLEVQAEYQAKTGKRISRREAKALLAIKRAKFTR